MVVIGVWFLLSRTLELSRKQLRSSRVIPHKNENGTKSAA